MNYERYLKAGFPDLLPELEQFSTLIGKQITVHRADHRVSGTALGFTTDGGIKLRTREGLEEIIWVGDITLVQNDSPNEA